MIRSYNQHRQSVNGLVLIILELCTLIKVQWRSGGNDGCFYFAPGQKILTVLSEELDELVRDHLRKSSL